MKSDLWVIVPAGGLGRRSGLPVPKQYALIGRRTVLEWTVMRILAVDGVRGIVLSLPAAEIPDDLEIRLKEVIEKGPGHIELLGVTGGSTRQESVANALYAVPSTASYIAVHDASRPLATPELFKRVYDAAMRYGAAIPGLPPIETLKVLRHRGGFPQVGEDRLVSQTLDRSSLVAVQTPQVFRADILRQAHNKAKEDGYVGTDDSSLVERLGIRVAVVQGEPDNFKITFEGDLSRAKATLRRQGFLKTVRAVRRGLRGAVGYGPAVVGFGFDVHPLETGRRCILGGVDIPCSRGPAGHSDADVVCHAAADAVLGAVSMGDIGFWFPPDNPLYQGASSIDLLRRVREVTQRRARCVHLDITVVAEEPRIMPHVPKMRKNIACALAMPEEEVSIKATTAEKLGTLGRKEGIAAYAVATLRKLTGGVKSGGRR